MPSISLGFQGRRILEELGLSLTLLQKMSQLGFVLAGSSAAYLLAAMHDIEVSPPNDFDFFYKGGEDMLPRSAFPDFAQRNGLEVDNPESRFGLANACLLQAGLRSRGESAYAANYYGEVAAPADLANLLRSNVTAEYLPWGGTPVTPQPTPPTPTLGVKVQVITGGDLHVIRPDTFQARLLDALQPLSPEEAKEALDLLGTVLVPPRNATWEEIVSEWKQRPRGTPVPKIWTRFDFTVSCVEIEGDEIHYHPLTLADLKNKTIRFQTLHRHPVKALFRIQKYQKKGFQITPEESLKLGQMLANLPPNEQALVSEYMAKHQEAIDAGVDPEQLPDDYTAVAEPSLALQVIEARQAACRASSELDLLQYSALDPTTDKLNNLRGGIFDWIPRSVFDRQINYIL